jgi:hypothetical protein
MKRIYPLLFFPIIVSQTIYSQTVVSQGKPIAEIFTDFHYNIKDSTKTTGFGLNRAYIGYNYLPSGNFSGTLIVTIGNPDDLPSGSVHHRYAYFREASVTYTYDKLRITGGITGTRIFDFQQKFWGKRYLANTFETLNGYGDVADLGVALDYKFNEIWSGDFTVMNGEGYSDIQRDNGVRTSAGLTFTPVKQIAVRIYGDAENLQNSWRYTLIGFFGFKNSLVTIGIEASYRSDLDKITGHDAWGLSGTGGVNIFKKTELFARCDYSTSVTLPGESIPWNFLKDGRFAIYGLQYTFTENVKLALNYQGIYPYNNGKQVTKAVYINALFKF